MCAQFSVGSGTVVGNILADIPPTVFSNVLLLERFQQACLIDFNKIVSLLERFQQNCKLA